VFWQNFMVDVRKPEAVRTVAGSRVLTSMSRTWMTIHVVFPNLDYPIFYVVRARPSPES
jgi:hypothetical protein